MTTCRYRLVTHHLLDPVKALAMEAESLLKQHFVLHRPVIWEWGEVRQVCQGLLNVVLVPEEHAKCLLDTHTHTHTVASSISKELIYECWLIHHK